MSGQPYRYSTDPSKFRQEYLDTLALQAGNNDMNYQANKTYNATKQLPAISQMPDTRGTSEILADTEKLKLSLIGDLKPLIDSQGAQAVVQRIMRSPLNTDGSLLVFFSQRAPELVKNLQKSYKFGIKGDNNDIEQLVLFVEKAYNDTKSIATTTQSYFNAPMGSLKTGVISEGELDELKKQYDQIVRKLILRAKEYNAIEMQGQDLETVPEMQFNQVIGDIIYKFKTLSEFLHSGEYKRMTQEVNDVVLDEVSALGTNKGIVSSWKQIHELLSRLPRADTLASLIGQLDKASENKSNVLPYDILQKINSLIPETGEFQQALANVKQPLKDKKKFEELALEKTLNPMEGKIWNEKYQQYEHIPGYEVDKYNAEPTGEKGYTRYSTEPDEFGKKQRIIDGYDDYGNPIYRTESSVRDIYGPEYEPKGYTSARDRTAREEYMIETGQERLHRDYAKVDELDYKARRELDNIYEHRRSQIEERNELQQLQTDINRQVTRFEEKLKTIPVEDRAIVNPAYIGKKYAKYKEIQGDIDRIDKDINNIDNFEIPEREKLIDIDLPAKRALIKKKEIFHNVPSENEQAYTSVGMSGLFNRFKNSSLEELQEAEKLFNNAMHTTEDAEEQQNYKTGLNFIEDQLRKKGVPTLSGRGLKKRRGRPKGSGIAHHLLIKLINPEAFNLLNDILVSVNT